MPFGALETKAALVRALHKTWRDTEHALVRHRAKVEAATREADYLRASVEELAKLDPEPQEEETLAIKRTDMMRSEKIAGDVNDANEVLSGNASPVPSLASLVRQA